MTTPAPLDATVAWLDLASRGWGLVVVPPRQQRDVAEALAARVPRPAVALTAALLADLDADAPASLVTASAAGGAFLYVAPEVGYDDEVALWRALNGRRDWMSDRGVWVIVASNRQLARLTAHAGDLASVARPCETVPFVPRALGDAEVAAARAELHAHYLRRFGRLDLRGFIRSEREDVSFPVEAIYQPLAGVVEPRYAVLPSGHAAGPAAASRSMPIVDALAARRCLDPRAPALVAATPSPSLLVGGPGSGKSFFLRHCAIAASRADAFAGQECPLPVHVPLAAMRTAAPTTEVETYAIDEFLDAGLGAAHAVASEAGAGRVLFLLDGLDEVDDARGAVAAQVAALAVRYPRCPVVVTSRPGGLAALELDAVRIDVAPLDDAGLTALLGAWCELYEIERAGSASAARGRAEGEQLAREVLASPPIGELARTPLLATIIAIVHRAGVRLPEHRVELYEHMTRVLVERWNQLRSQQADAPPVRVADAIRLLGPIAIILVRQSRDAAVYEDALRSLLQRELDRGAVRGFADAGAAVTTFRDSLGLLVETSPRIYGFLHKTLAEFLAAHELVRTGELERLLGTGEAFEPRWREVVLLALGIVGTLQANDRRLATCLDAVIGAARARRSSRDDAIPALLGGVLVDDPDLTPALAGALIDELVPAWWFDGAPVYDGEHAGTALAMRVLTGPWARPLAIALATRYREGWGERDGASLRGRIGPLGLLRRLGASQPLLLCEALVAAMARGEARPAGPERFMPLLQIPLPEDDPAAHLSFTMRISGLAVLLREGAGALFFAALPGDPRGDRSWITLEDAAGTRFIGRRLDAPPPEAIALVGTIHIAIAEHPDPALLPNVLAAWQELATRYPDAGPTPPASVEDAIARYGGVDVN